MIKDVFRYTAVIGVLLASTIFAGGCDYDEASLLRITKTSGMLAVTTWFAFDNPDSEVKNEVATIIDDIMTSSEIIEAGDTYLDVVYPQIVLRVDQDPDIKDQYKPLIKSGSIVILSGLDELIAMNPDIQKDRDTARKYVQAFCDGAKSGLLLNAANASMQRASKAYSLRMKLSRE